MQIMIIIYICDETLVECVNSSLGYEIYYYEGTNIRIRHFFYCIFEQLLFGLICIPYQTLSNNQLGSLETKKTGCFYVVSSSTDTFLVRTYFWYGSRQQDSLRPSEGWSPRRITASIISNLKPVKFIYVNNVMIILLPMLRP